MCDVTRRAGRTGSRPRPRWGALYAVVGVSLTVLAAMEAVPAADGVKTSLRFCAVLAAFAAMAVWARHQHAAFDLADWCDCAARQMTIREIPSHDSVRHEPDLEPALEENEEPVFTTY